MPEYSHFGGAGSAAAAIPGVVILAAGACLAGATAAEARAAAPASQVPVGRHDYVALQVFAVEVGSARIKSLSANDDFVNYRAAAAIGVRGVERLKKFSTLPNGWDGRDGQPLNKDSLDRLSDFFALTNFNAPDLSVFMTSEGNAVINWQRNDGLVEVEFGPTELSYYIEGSDVEDSRPMSAASMWELRQQL